jgi:hypothetical protein
VSAANYGILVNGNTYFAASYEGQDPYGEGFEQYLAHVQVKAGDFCQLCDADNKAVWAVDLNQSSVAGFTRNGDKYDVTVDGCYDFYIKLKYQTDQLYIGDGSDCGEGIDISGQGGGDTPGGGGEDEDVSYYAIGWINGADAGEAAYDKYDENYLFKDGKLTIDCQMGSYIAIKDHMCNYYYSRTETTIADSQVNLEWANGWSPCQKWAIPEGVNYIIIRSASYKGAIQLERVDKATYDAYHWGTQAVENTEVKEQARKVFVNGQLRIVREDKVFDATGRQL